MEEILPNSNLNHKIKNWLTAGINFLSWASPFIGFGVFFPIGVLVAYPQNRKIREAAFQSFIIQVFIILVCFPIDILAIFNETTETFVQKLKMEYAVHLGLFWAFSGLIFLFLEARFLIRKKGRLNLFFEKNQEPSIEPETSFFKTLIFVIIVWMISIFWFIALTYFFVSINSKDQNFQETMKTADQLFKGESSLMLWFLTLFSASSMLGRKGILSILRKPYLGFYIQTKLAFRTFTKTDDPDFKKKALYSKVREAVLPGWGHIYLQRYWKGFSLLFSFLLIFLFFSSSLAFFIDPIFGIKFLTTFGLKIGIPDKEFMQYIDNPIYPIAGFLFLLSSYAISNLMLRSALKNEDQPFSERGLQTGFSNNLYLSLLAHLILFAIIFIIPISVQRNSSAKKKNDLSKQHFTPEKMEFYFIDPEIPDQVKDLNGGVVAGTETPSKTEGEKIPDKLPQDEGKVKGYVKRIKGKKLPKTYSNYISARMRGPENFMNYWRRAPMPYSCVVAYTITTEGEVEDVMIVESSAYPEQDSLTIELIQSLSPLMPPPGTKGNIRVTELFWNGTLDPNLMPTELQKEMVQHFDGRYMEEEP